MTKIFHNIRKKLAAENKVMAYLRYAVGEILLVVIGILIALQVNNWNEVQKIKKQEKDFFSEVLNDLQKDQNRITYLNKYLQNRIRCDDTLLYYVRNPQKQMGLEKFGNYVEPLYYGETAISYSTTFESAKASDAISGFQQKGLIKDLTQYYADFESIKGTLNSISTFVENRFEPIMATISEGYINENTGSLVVTEESVKDFYRNVAGVKDKRKHQADYKSILKNLGFESYLIGDLGRSYNSIAKIEARQNRISEIGKEIRKYLNDKNIP